MRVRVRFFSNFSEAKIEKGAIATILTHKHNKRDDDDVYNDKNQNL